MRVPIRRVQPHASFRCVQATKAPEASVVLLGHCVIFAHRC
jgi:hypothetical protein